MVCTTTSIIINILIVILLVIGILDIFGLFDKNNNQFIPWILIIISVYSLLGEFFELPFLIDITKYINKLFYTKASPIITKIYRKKQKKEFDYYFKDK